jgi:cytidine deaminase
MATDIDWGALRKAATETMHHAYAPYSDFPVGAAGLVDDGRLVVGCNVENAAYGVVLCAECGMVSSLHATGGGRLVAVSCVDRSGAPIMPCGRCRQLLWENGGPDCLVDSATGPIPMSTLLPHAFEAADMGRAAPAIPARLRRYQGRGTVFVHPDVAGGQRVWTGYWERSTGTGEDPPGILDEAPSWPSPLEAVAWGRARTPRVVVVDVDGGTYWAGVGAAPPELPEWPETKGAS